MARTKKNVEETAIETTAATAATTEATTKKKETADERYARVFDEAAVETAKKKKKSEEDFISIEDETFEVTVRITFTNDVFGLTPNNPEMYSQFLAIKADKSTKSKDPSKIAEAHAEYIKNIEEEIGALVVADNLEDALDKGTTIFPKDKDGNPGIWRYQWKGYIKEKIQAALYRRNPMISAIANWRSGVSNDLFIVDKFNVIHMPEGQEITLDQRPIRFKDSMGQQISAIASCEVVPAGSWTDVTFKVYRAGWLPVIKYCLDKGIEAGTGSRRCDGQGTFTYEVIEGNFNCTKDQWKLMIAKNASK